MFNDFAILLQAFIGPQLMWAQTISMTPPNIPDMATDELILGKKKKGKDKIKKDEEERVEEEKSAVSCF
jgi:hypothetical protein